MKAGYTVARKTMTVSTKRRSTLLSLGRWAWTLLVATAAAPLFLILLAYGQAVWAQVPTSAALAPNLILFGGFAISVASVVVALRLLRPRWSHLRESIRFPTLTIPAAMAIALGWTYWARYGGTIAPPDSRTGALLAFAAIAGTMVYRMTLTSEETPFAEVTSLSADETEGILRWTETDEPARHPDPDLFGARDLAKRLAAVLTGTRRERAVALLGSYGIGKTVVLRELERLLQHERTPRVWTTRVSCWGLESAKDAPRYILENAVEALDLRIDTHCLRGLPEAYQRLVDGTGGGVLQSVGLRPHWRDVVRTLQDVLDSAGARLVLLIEDSDRHEEDFDPHHLARLMDELRTSRNITFVLAVDEQLTSLDLRKACDHLFSIPQPDPASKRHVLRVLRAHARKGGFIDPFNGRDALFDIDSPRGPLDEAMRRRFGGGVVDALTEVISTPREMKHVARRIQRVLQRIPGELDLDELIALSVLAECEPAAYKFLHTHRHALREPKRQAILPSQTSDYLAHAWSEIKAQSSHPGALERIVEFLRFEGLPTVHVGEKGPQTVGKQTSADYLQRHYSESVPATEASDQEVLRTIDLYTTGSKEVLLDALLKSTERATGFLGAWEDLSGRHPPEALLELTSELLERIRRRDGSEAAGDHEALLALWRVANHQLGATEARDKWLSEELQKSVAVSLEQANTLYYYWASVQARSATPSGRTMAREVLVSAFKSLAVEAGRIPRVLSEQSPWALARLRTPADQDEASSGFTGAEYWNFTADLFLQLLADENLRVAPHIAHFFARPSVTGQQDLSLNEPFLRAVAQDRLTELTAAITRRSEAFSGSGRFIEQVGELYRRLEGSR